MSFNVDCPRGLDNCEALANVVSDPTDNPREQSFCCVGYNQPKNRKWKQDIFTHCWVTADRDDKSDNDRRDLIEVISVFGQALSIDENIRVAQGRE